MEIDPCAASRFEIVTKTSDLTAFELAGGTLDEPTPNVSTISGSPSYDRRIVNDMTIKQAHLEGKKVTWGESHSPAHAQPIVKSEAVKQMLAEITYRVRCDICDMVCYGKESFKRHNEGKKHLENAQKLSVANKEKLPLPVAYAKLNQESEKNEQDLLLNEELVNSSLKGKKAGGTLGDPTTNALAQPIKNDVVIKQSPTEIFDTIPCDICDVICFGMEAFKRHKGKKHLKNSQKLPVAIKQTKSPLAANEILVNSLSICDIPDLASCHNRIILAKHIEGEKAGETLNKPTKIVSTPSDSSANFKVCNQQTVKEAIATKPKSVNGKNIFCDICNVTCNSQKVFKRHMKGKKHVKNTRISTDIPDLATYLNQNIVTKKPFVYGTQKAHAKLDIRQPTRCEVCKGGYRRHRCFAKQKSGKRHLKNLKNSEKNMAKSGSPAPAANRSLRNPMIKEGKVVFFAERGKRKNHSSSATNNEDSNAKRKKVMEEEEVGSGVLVTCKACNVTCNGITAFDAHLASFEHSATRCATSHWW